MQTAKYILFQRTEYLPKWALYLPYKLGVSLAALLFSRQVVRRYIEDMRKEYELIAEHVGAPTSVLDIGSGIGGINVFFNADICLLDKTTTEDKIYYHFKDRGAFYNSLDLAQKFVRSHSNNVVTTYEADGNLPDDRYDLILSLQSCGFHYPVDTYLGKAYNKLVAGGAIVLDVRKNTGGYEKVKERFGNVKVILESKKFVRVVAYKLHQVT